MSVDEITRRMVRRGVVADGAEPLVFDLDDWWMVYFKPDDTHYPVQARARKGDGGGIICDGFASWVSVSEEDRMRSLFSIVSLAAAGELTDERIAFPL